MNKKRMYFVLSIISIFTVYSIYELNQDYNDSHMSRILDNCSFVVECAIDELQLLSETESKKIVLDTFDGIVLTYTDSLPFCHTEVHHMGPFLYHYLDDLNESLSHVDSRTCGGALIHGIVQSDMIAQFQENNNPSEVNITTICPTKSNNSPLTEIDECIHGIGHGLTSIYKNDVLTAVVRCNQLDAEWKQDRCAQGVFMENLVTYFHTGVGDLIEDDPLYPCSKTTERFLASCYYTNSVLFINFDLKNENSNALCEGVSKKFAKYCFRGIGASDAEEFYMNTSNICKSLDYEYQTYCYMGAAHQIADQRPPGEALQFCTTIPDEFKSDCYDEIGKWIKTIYSDSEKITQECSKAESSYYSKICLNAILEENRIL